MTAAPIEVLIGRLAEAQHGLVARWQLLEIGLSREQIFRRLRSGHFRPVYRGVYAVGHRPRTRSSRFMAAVLAAGVGAVLSQASAAAHHEIRGWGGGPIHVTAPHRVRRDRRICAHQARLPADEIEVIDGIPTTGISRTLFDLAATAGAEVFHAALRQAEQRRILDTLTLADLLERYPRRHGAPIVRAALESKRYRGVRTRSGLEDGFLAFLDARGLPLPDVNTFIEAGGCTYEADCAWRDRHVVAELDHPYTHSDDEAFENDRLRDRRLLLAGWRTIRITQQQLQTDPDGLERDLRQLLGLRG